MCLVRLVLRAKLCASGGCPCRLDTKILQTRRGSSVVWRRPCARGRTAAAAHGAHAQSVTVKQWGMRCAAVQRSAGSKRFVQLLTTEDTKRLVSAPVACVMLKSV